MTPLHWSVKKNNFKFTRFLIKKKSHLDAKDLVKKFNQIGRTPLMVALKENLYIMAMILLNEGASPWSSETCNYNDVL